MLVFSFAWVASSLTASLTSPVPSWCTVSAWFHRRIPAKSVSLVPERWRSRLPQCQPQPLKSVFSGLKTIESTAAQAQTQQVTTFELSQTTRLKLFPVIHDASTPSIPSPHSFQAVSTAVQWLDSVWEQSTPSTGVFNWADHVADNFSVVVVQTDNQVIPSGRGKNWQTQRWGFWWQVLQQRAVQGPTRFQVWVQGYLVAELPNGPAAEQLAEKIRSWLANPQPQASELEPAIAGGQVIGKVGDRVLFTVEPSWTEQLQQDQQTLALQWVNGLRVALGAPELSPLDAEIRFQGLAATGEHIGGIASWYGPYFHGRLTANGEIFDENALTAAHPSLPFNTYLKVTNLHNGREVLVRINDRGPYIGDRSLDLSREAARQLGSESTGIIDYQAEILQPVAQPFVIAQR